MVIICWLIGIGVPNRGDNIKMEREAASKSDWMKFLFCLYDIQINGNNYYYPGLFNIAGTLIEKLPGLTEKRTIEIAKYLKRKRYVHLEGDFNLVGKKVEMGKEIVMKLTKRGIKRVEEETERPHKESTASVAWR
jgi:hypothetical protein